MQFVIVRRQHNARSPTQLTKDRVIISGDALSGKASLQAFFDMPDPNNRLFKIKNASHLR